MQNSKVDIWSGEETEKSIVNIQKYIIFVWVDHHCKGYQGITVNNFSIVFMDQITNVTIQRSLYNNLEHRTRVLQFYILHWRF